ncbi:BadF/BadG/BcrA/BcrD ATPase family protein [Verrucosispora sp. ts21]|uniref:N-acetylglucosamine kinase n=1 Tax=Verrucosispora sp. ts21 TaxID=2069341 RepID=UPI001E401B15|nr:BadF/BadG/BcrA/BcrD ATPase family protein [Verrucosispora sp. ts21]
MSGSVVVGLDVGGTSTRALAVTLDGDRLGTGRAGGGNPTTHGAAHAAEQLLIALRQALTDVDPTRVRAGVIGLAGAGRLRADPAARAAVDHAWAAAGLRCPYAVHGDALIAYASGTADPDGTILIAGTGAVAAQVRDLRLDRVADGHGWLLGDDGSGFWLGRQAVRRLLAALDTDTDPGDLGRRVLTELTGSAEVAPHPRTTVDTLIQTVTRRPPVELARLAPLVLAAADPTLIGDATATAPIGDATATALIAEAADLLVATVRQIRPPDDRRALVLGGGLLTGDNPLAASVHAQARRQWPHAPITTAGDGAAAAAWLAARTLPEATAPTTRHSDTRSRSMWDRVVSETMANHSIQDRA